MNGSAPLVDVLGEGRARFLELVRDLRPALHRYCARMVGSIFDGEDVVQEALARAFYELSQLKEPPAMKSWLFRIAHNAATDRLRSTRRWEEVAQELDDADALVSRVVDDLETQALRTEDARRALHAFLHLPPSQRACVILKDVLDFSLDEIADVLAVSVQSVKAALHRGRARLGEPERAPLSPAQAALARKYAELFDARDWDGVRTLLADDVKLDLVSMWKREGAEEVSQYYGNYASIRGWTAHAAVVEGRAGIVITLPSGDWYFVALDGHAPSGGNRVGSIKDYRYAAYMFDGISPVRLE